MKRYYLYALLTLPVMLMLTGCMEMSQPSNSVTHSEPLSAPPAVSQQREISDPTRFQNPATGQSALDSAIELSKKFAALSEEMAGLQVAKEKLAVENAELKEQIAKILPEAEQARKELAEANDLLVEMRIELNNWKTDVLGFREEIRQADKIQLEALLKILRVLGGEEMVINTPSGAGAATQSANEPNGNR